MRTRVAPAAMAATKSDVIPMLTTGIGRLANPVVVGWAA